MHIQRHTHTSTHVKSAHKRNGDNQAQEKLVTIKKKPKKATHDFIVTSHSSSVLSADRDWSQAF